MKTVEIQKWPKGSAPTQHVYDPPPYVKFDHVPISQADSESYTCSHPGFPPHDIIVKISQVYADDNVGLAEVDGYKCIGG